MVIRSEPARVKLRTTVQTLGGYTYAIPEVTPSKRSAFAMIAPVVALVFFPITILAFLISTGLMVLGPKSLKQTILAQIIPSTMKAAEKVTENQRKLLLQHASGRVLDVGCGGGAYLSLLKNKASHVVALEPNGKMHPLIRQQAKEASFKDYQVTILTDTVEEYAAANPNAPHFDWVIFGNVLCEVENVPSTLTSVHKLLKPGGHVYFSEHVAAPRDTKTRQLQDCCNPVWNRISGGCNCNRDSVHDMEGMAEWEVVSWEMSHIKVGLGPFIMGLAQKVQGV
mmetsp:Transcript_8646/g.14372  ORF Transcript_8646/g.14372 Transcript_8646/m.14372 type:complete len:282 (+) Transcript_8646:147-992(+)|eukprot:CAMPEP_0119019484 /NCGR_PEP_ID=MMETSP1176-20130426/21942_1 /TAXON_ID=265551 /ORGANISM="Synedropsis recta cf, Strain CCMP1620" /LENGTH=281 /DNA_ID=CAMNT_0006973691 /DNA_START=128 /DNA_END=973 /DNA_ORIENTATION=-